MSHPLTPQPTPKKGDSREVAEFAMELLEMRIMGGVREHGTPLQVDSGRDHYADALQEQLDGVQYLAAAWLHRERYGATFRFALGDIVRWVREVPEREDCQHWLDVPYRVVRRRHEDWMAGEHWGAQVPYATHWYSIQRCDPTGSVAEDEPIAVQECVLQLWEDKS